MLITGICYLGNISRTQRIIKKDIISFPLPVLHYFKTSKSQHLPINQEFCKALKTQSNFENCFLKRDLSVAEDLSV